MITTMHYSLNDRPGFETFIPIINSYPYILRTTFDLTHVDEHIMPNFNHDMRVRKEGFGRSRVITPVDMTRHPKLLQQYGRLFDALNLSTPDDCAVAMRNGYAHTEDAIYETIQFADILNSEVIRNDPLLDAYIQASANTAHKTRRLPPLVWISSLR